jgi:pimeloyl-ACP methyl ester carboxylesterase
MRALPRIVLAASDGTKLAGAEWGSGARGVVLLPQCGGNLCGYWNYATELVAAGFHALAIDFRPSGRSERRPVADLTIDAVAAVEWLKAAGATKVVLLGASLGAATAMVTAGRKPDLVSAVVTLSLPSIGVTGGNGPDPTTADEAAPLIHVPLLMCWSASDRDAVNPQRFINASPASDMRLVTREGSTHGWLMPRTGTTDVRPEVLAFLERYA